MIAVVTGSSGFIGSHLVEALLARGATVRALIRPDSRSGTRDPRVTYHVADLLDDRSLRENAIWTGVTHVFHVAGVTKARTLSEFREGNVVPTANILAALAARGSRLQRFVLVSSQAAAGPAAAADRAVREDDAPHPVEAYGRSKLEAEQATLRFADTLPVTIIRPSAVYGPRDVDFLNVFRQATNRIAVFAAPAEQLMSIVHVSDLVRAIIRAIEQPRARGRTYFVGSDAPVSWRTLYEMSAALASTTYRAVQLPQRLLRLAGHAGDVFSRISGRAVLLNTNKVSLAVPKWWLCDSSRAREELAWRPEVDLQDGLRDTYLWYCQAGLLRRKRDVEMAAAPLPEERV
ncbi:MAG: NAD-dependent epimerase/dehydratase family protein [Gemmatimonadota bacterium]|nr:NAD-dependent epimerase/dehydratase family protein [Gemmatimonadota bacterium]